MFHDPEASTMDAFTFSWKDLHPYIFTPFTIIPRILSKIKTDTVDKAIIIVPLWPSLLWFPLLISLIVSFPVRLPRHKYLTSMPSTGLVLLHPLTRKTDFAAVQLSGNLLLIKEFRLKNQHSSSHHGEKKPQNNICCAGGNGCFGVVEGLKIPLLHLR